MVPKYFWRLAEKHLSLVDSQGFVDSELMVARVVGVFKSQKHTFHKYAEESITLEKGLGVRGDAHNGEAVKHRSRVAKDPTQPNLRQVHFIHSELFTELCEKEFEVLPGQLGENITTEGIDLLSLPTGTRLCIGGSAMVEITGLRNPCAQIDSFQKGLLKAVLDKDKQGKLIRKAGVMGVVLEGGLITVGDPIIVKKPDEPHRPLERV